MGTIAEKLSYLDETREQILTNIQALGGDLTEESTFRSYADALDEVWEEQDHVTGTGTELTLNTKKGKMKVELSPSELEQETTSISGGDEYDSPSPEHPQEIHTVSGENTVVVGNKNLLNRTTCEENKALSWTNGTIFNDTNSLASDYIKVSANEEYALNYRSQFMFYDKDKNYLGCIQSDGITIAKATGIYNNKVTIPNIEEIYYMRLGFRAIANQGVDLLTANIMVNFGDTALDYVPHQEQNFPISLGNLEYCKIGDYEDEFYKATESDTGLTAGKWYLKKNIKKLVLDGSESWVIFNSSSSRVTFRTIINDIEGYTNGNTIPNIISNRFIPNSYNVTWVIGNVSRTIASGGQNFVLFVYEPNTTVEQFKEWLSSNNTIVYYVLATPTYTLLSETLQTQLEAIWRANSYEEQTNISQENNDLPFVINAKALGIETEVGTLSLNSLNTMSLNPRLDTETVEPTIEEQEESVEEEEQ